MKKGFTLLEIIITLFLLGVVVLVIFSVFNKGLNIIQHNYLKRQAIDLAASYLEAERYNGPTTTIVNPFPYLAVNKTVNRQGPVSQVQVIVSWNDALNKNSSIELTRNYYWGIN